MRKIIDGALVAAIWLSAAGAVAGFLLPWASIDVKYRGVVRDVAGTANNLLGDVPLGDAAQRLTQKLGKIVISVKRGAETVTGELPDLSQIPTQVNGPQIPQLVNRPDAHLVIALTEMFTGQQQIGPKSYAVYAVPVLAVLFALLLTVSGRVALVAVLVSLASVAVGGGTLWKLMSTSTDAALMKITIKLGLWLICWSFIALGVLGLLRAGSAPKRPSA